MRGTQKPTNVAVDRSPVDSVVPPNDVVNAVRQVDDGRPENEEEASNVPG